MKEWMMKFFETLAGKLTAILAFAVLIIGLLALWGSRIPAEYRPLVYIVAILAMLIFAWQFFLRRKPVKKEGVQQPPEIDKKRTRPRKPKKPRPIWMPIRNTCRLSSRIAAPCAWWGSTRRPPTRREAA
jgi:hypothetical protein